MSAKEQDPGHIVTGVILWTIDGHERNAAAPSTFLAVPGLEKGTFLARNEPYGLPQRAPEAVEAGNNEGVIRPHVRERSIEARTLPFAAHAVSEKKPAGNSLRQGRASHGAPRELP